MATALTCAMMASVFVGSGIIANASNEVTIGCTNANEANPGDTIKIVHNFLIGGCDNGNEEVTINIQIKDQLYSTNSKITIGDENSKYTLPEKYNNYDVTKWIISCGYRGDSSPKHAVVLLPGYAITLNNATEKNNHTYSIPGANLTVTADAAPANQVFDKWVSGDITISDTDAKNSTLTFEMPAKPVTITATYKAATATPSTTTPKTYTSLDELPIGTVLYKGDMIKIADEATMQYYVSEGESLTMIGSASNYVIKDPGTGYVGWYVSKIEDLIIGSNGNETSGKAICLTKKPVEQQQNPTSTTPSASGDKKASNSSAPAHEHSYSWVIESEATVGSDGVEVYKCSCGDIQARSVIPASQVYVNKLRDAIVNAPINGTVTYDSKLYHTFSDYIIKRLAERTDVTTVIDFKWQNADYTMTIPAGVDYAPFFADTENFYGYFCFAQMTGASIVAK